MPKSLYDGIGIDVYSIEQANHPFRQTPERLIPAEKKRTVRGIDINKIIYTGRLIKFKTCRAIKTIFRHVISFKQTIFKTGNFISIVFRIGADYILSADFKGLIWRFPQLSRLIRRSPKWSIKRW